MNVHELAAILRKKNPGLSLKESLGQGEQILSKLQKVPKELRAATFAELQVPDYNMSKVGDLLAGVLEEIPEAEKRPFDRGPRDEGEPRRKPGRVGRGETKPGPRLSPTHIERMNRAFQELSFPAQAVHSLLLIWRGAAAKGNLPFFTRKSLARFFATDVKVIRRALGELVSKGWIEPGQYDCHKKNSLYRLVPIVDVPKPSQ